MKAEKPTSLPMATKPTIESAKTRRVLERGAQVAHVEREWESMPVSERVGAVLSVALQGCDVQKPLQKIFFRKRGEKGDWSKLNGSHMSANKKKKIPIENTHLFFKVCLQSYTRYKNKSTHLIVASKQSIYY